MARLFADNDVLLKAAHWGLLEQVPGCTGIQWESTSVPESLIYRTHRRDKKLFRDAAAADALKGYLERTAPLPAPDPGAVSRLQRVQGIDAGEVALIGAMCNHDDSILLTGDKRALRALASELPDLALKLKGRVVCLEHLIERALGDLGPHALAVKISAYRDLDIAVRCIVPLPNEADESRIRQGLASYINELQRETNGLLGFAATS